MSEVFGRGWADAAMFSGKSMWRSRDDAATILGMAMRSGGGDDAMLLRKAVVCSGDDAAMLGKAVGRSGDDVAMLLNYNPLSDWERTADARAFGGAARSTGGVGDAGDVIDAGDAIGTGGSRGVAGGAGDAEGGADEERERQEGNRGGWLAVDVILALLLLVLVYVLAQSVWFADKSLLVLGAPAVDPQAYVEPVEDAGGGEDGLSASSGQSSLQYALSAVADGGQVRLYFKNPADSGVGLTVRLMVVGSDGRTDCLAQSGLLVPGAAVGSLDQLDVQLQPGTYEGYYAVDFYNLDTGDKAYLDAVLKGVTVEVR